MLDATVNTFASYLVVHRVAGQEPMRAFFNPSLFPLGGGERVAVGL